MRPSRARDAPTQCFGCTGIRVDFGQVAVAVTQPKRFLVVFRHTLVCHHFWIVANDQVCDLFQEFRAGASARGKYGDFDTRHSHGHRSGEQCHCRGFAEPSRCQAQYLLLQRFPSFALHDGRHVGRAAVLPVQEAAARVDECLVEFDLRA